MTTTPHDLSRLFAAADGIALEGGMCCHQPHALIPPLHRQDDEAVSNSLPPTGTGTSIRAAVAAGHELARLAAALAFFRSRSSSKPAANDASRLRV